MSKQSKKKKQNTNLPDWTPENAGDEFAVKIVKGVKKHEREYSSKSKIKKSFAKKSKLKTEDYVRGVLNNDRTVLAKTITLIESNSPAHYSIAQKVLKQLLPYSGKSLRIGITGVPGSGKSTFIESFGSYLIKEGHKVAVLTVDPSSTVTKGSILGDKTRMEKLSREENCFIRPSPSRGTLGGVTRKSRETIIVCEAAGFDVILIETIGVGQSEVTVRSMVDFFLLLMIAGAGDELQGIKKGVMELADTLLINKADGDNVRKANRAKAEYSNALHYLQPATKGWVTEAYTCSALNGEGIPEIWKVIKIFEKITKQSGIFNQRRKEQALEWVFKMIENELVDNFYKNTVVKKSLKEYKEKILNERILPTVAAENLLKNYYSSKK